MSEQGEQTHHQTDANQEGLSSSSSGDVSPTTAPQSPLASGRATPESLAVPPVDNPTNEVTAVDEAATETAEKEQCEGFVPTVLSYSLQDLIQLWKFRLVPPFQEDDIELPLSEVGVSSVVFGGDGLQVTRVATVNVIKPGVNVVKITQCTEVIRNGHAQVTLNADLTNVFFLDLKWETCDYESTESVRKRKRASQGYEQEKGDIERRLDQLQDQVKMLRASLDQALANIDTSSSDKSLSNTDALKYIQNWNEEYESVSKFLSRERERLSQCEVDWQTIEAGLPQDSVEEEYMYALVVVFYAAAEGPQQLTLTYSDRGYSWNANYKYHFITRDEDLGLKPYVHIQYFITCKHTINETWQNIAVEVSTENLQRNSLQSGLPRLQLALMEKETAWKTLQKCVNREIQILEHALVPDDKVVCPTVDEKYLALLGDSRRFILPERFTFSLNSDVTILVNQFVANCSREFYCSPTDSSDVYCWMKFVNPLANYLPPGQVTVLLNNSFSHKTNAALIAPLDIVECSAGVEDCMRVTLDLTFSKEPGGLFRGARTTIRNLINVYNQAFGLRDYVTVLLHAPKVTCDKVKLNITTDRTNSFSFKLVEEKPGFTNVVMSIKLPQTDYSRGQGGAINFVVDYPDNLLLQLHPAENMLERPTLDYPSHLTAGSAREE